MKYLSQLNCSLSKNLKEYPIKLPYKKCSRLTFHNFQGQLEIPSRNTPGAARVIGNRWNLTIQVGPLEFSSVSDLSGLPKLVNFDGFAL
jgi:hypothetical protein